MKSQTQTPPELTWMTTHPKGAARRMMRSIPLRKTRKRHHGSFKLLIMFVILLVFLWSQQMRIHQETRNHHRASITSKRLSSLATALKTPRFLWTLVETCLICCQLAWGWTWHGRHVRDWDIGTVRGSDWRYFELSSGPGRPASETTAISGWTRVKGKWAQSLVETTTQISIAHQSRHQEDAFFICLSRHRNERRSHWAGLEYITNYVDWSLANKADMLPTVSLKCSMLLRAVLIDSEHWDRMIKTSMKTPLHDRTLDEYSTWECTLGNI